MNECCPACAFRFERESGYFMGALVLGYFIGAFSVVPTLVVLIFFAHVKIETAALLGCLQVIIFNPVISKYSRLAWLYFDHRADPAS